MKNRYLTKSRYKLATECATKLFYTAKKEYANQSLDDSFLLALAEGGFQVGDLAKCYFPGGHDITTLDYKDAIAQTNALLELDNVIIYEAAISTKKLFIRADILVKTGPRLELFEVKAKSFDPTEKNPFFGKNGSVNSSWRPYLEDVAFQKHVIKTAFPQFTVSGHLMLADKSAVCPTDGLNQKFRVAKDANGRKSVVVSPQLNAADLSPPILCKVNVDVECGQIYAETHNALTFSQQVNLFADSYIADKKIPSLIGKHCAGCEFDTKASDTGLKSGRKECWKEQLGWGEKDFNDLTVLDVWNFRKKDKLIAQGCIKMSDVHEEDIAPQPDSKPGISTSERQWLQIQKYKNKDVSIWLDRDNLQDEISSWTFPLHFIDFETSMAAIPFHAGRKPYEGLAFQFSHHIVERDGTARHAGEFLNTQSGVFPNYEFIRALKKQLGGDEGTVFRYSNHENTFLNMIYRQLREDDAQVEDREALCDFIQLISHSKQDSTEYWQGQRDMVDLWELVKRYYYDPATNGSNSIKQVLPAILNSSQFLQNKYSKPLYGAAGGVSSLNFTNWQWIRKDGEHVIDPYKLLPNMFDDVSDKDMRLLSDDNFLDNGGAALMAYSRMQFEEMSDYERSEIEKALLKYCELDTMAMVMIYEGWKDLLSQK